VDVASEEAAKPEEEKPEYEWVLASGGPGKPHKQSGLDSLLQKLSPLSASDIVDPAKKAEWGLEPPAYRCVVTLEGEDKEVCIEGGRPDPSGDGYVRIADGEEDLVYKVSKYTFEQLFPKGTDLFDLPALTLDKNKITRIDLTQPEGNVSLVKIDDTWTVAAPVADLDVQESTLGTIASTLANVKPGDYADADMALGAATRVATVVAAGKTHTLKVCGDSKHIEGAYGTLDDGKAILTLKKTDVDKIFVAPKDLYARALLDIDEDDIKGIDVSGTAATFSLARKDDEAWTITLGGTTSEAEKAACDSLAGDIAGLEASDIMFGKTEIEGAPDATVQVHMQNGETHTIAVGANKDGVHQVMVAGKSVVFGLDHGDASKVLLKADALKKAEEKAPAEAAPAPVEVKVEEAAPAPVEVKVEEAAPAPVEVKVEEPAPAPTPVEVKLETPAPVEVKLETPAPAPEVKIEAPAPEAQPEQPPAPDAPQSQ